MALSYVGGNTGAWAGATTGTNNVSLTGLTGGSSSSAAAGDFVVAVYATGSTADRALTITDGTNNYTIVGSELYSNGTSYDTNFRVAYKLLTAADANVVFGPTGNNADAGAAAVHVWRGIDGNTQLDVSAITATGTATGRPNAGQITPTTSGAIVLVAGGGAAQTGANNTASELSNFVTTSSADNNDAMVGLGSYAWTSGAFDPAAWTGGTTNAGDSWAAITLALRPASSPSGDMAATETGSDTALISGQVIVQGTMAATETGDDIFSASGVVITATTGTMAVTETGSDTASGSGVVLIQGSMSATESGSDVANFSGQIFVQGTLAATESAIDSANFSGSVIVQGTFDASETGSDVASFSGRVGAITFSATIYGAGNVTATISFVKLFDASFNGVGLLTGQISGVTLFNSSFVGYGSVSSQLYKFGEEWTISTDDINVWTATTTQQDSWNVVSQGSNSWNELTVNTNTWTEKITGNNTWQG